LWLPATTSTPGLYAARFGNDPPWILQRIRADAVVIPEEGPQQTYLHRYVRIGNHDAEFTYDTGVIMASNYLGDHVPDGDPATGLAITGEIACPEGECASTAVGSAYLDFTIDHANIGELSIELESPDGNVARHDFADDGPLGVENINSILGTQHLPHIFDDVKGDSIDGTWTVRVYDDASSNHGYVYRATLMIDAARVEVEAVIEAPDVARPDEPFEVVVTLRNLGNLDITSAPLTLELVDDETDEMTDIEEFEPDYPLSPGVEVESTHELIGPQGTYTLYLTTTGLTPDLPPGLHGASVPVSITYRTFASFEVDPGVPQPDEEAQLLPLSRGIIDSYSWDFGDGTTSTDANPVHSWVEEGEYEVTLTVTGPDGTSATARTIEVAIGDGSQGFVSEGGGCACAVTGGADRSAPWLPIAAALMAMFAGLVRLRGRRSLAALGLASLVFLASCEDSHGRKSDADTDTVTYETGPWISLLDPADPSEDNLMVWVMLSDMESDPCDVTLEYRVGDQAFRDATLADPADVESLDSSPEGTEHGIGWLTVTDLTDDTDGVQIRVQAVCGGEETLPVLSERFTLNNFLVAHPNAVLITEISSAEANVPADYEADYVELTNTTEDDISLSGWTLIVWGSGSAEMVYPLDGIAIEAGRRIIIVEAEGEIPGGIPMEDLFPWTVDSGGAVALIATRSRGLDFVRWGGSPALPPEDISWTDGPLLPIPQTFTVLNRIDETTDTDDAVDFCVARPTPGGPTRGCITRYDPGDVLISELDCQGMYDSVEVYNTLGEVVDLGGWILLWDGGDDLGGGTTPLGMFGIPEYERVQLRDNGTAGWYHSGILDLGENLNIDGLMPTALALQDPYGNIIDFLAAGGSKIRWVEWLEEEPTPIPGPDTTLSRRPGDLDTDSASDWCLTHDNMGTGSTTCLSPLAIDLRISEVNPGRPDWVEIYNPGSTSVDLSRVFLSYTSPYYGGSVGDYRLTGTLAPGAMQVVTERDLGSLTGEIIVEGNMALAPEGDGTVALRDEYGFGLDFVMWGDPSGTPLWPDEWPGLGYDTHAEDDDISIQRYPHDAADTDSRDDWCWAEPTPRAPNNVCE